MDGKMSAFINPKLSTPRTSIRSAITATESGRRSARRTIHIGDAESRFQGSLSRTRAARFSDDYQIDFQNRLRDATIQVTNSYLARLVAGEVAEALSDEAGEGAGPASRACLILSSTSSSPSKTSKFQKRMTRYPRRSSSDVRASSYVCWPAC